MNTVALDYSHYKVLLKLQNTGIEQTLRAFRKEFGEHIKEYELIPNTREHKYDFYPFG